MYIASDGIHTAVISREDQPMNPRDPDYQDNLSTMICWHRRYNLGDEHSYDDAQAFFEDLAEQHLEEHSYDDAQAFFEDLAEQHLEGIDLLRVLRQGELQSLRLHQRGQSAISDNTQVIFDIQYHHGAASGSPDWCNTGWIVSEEGDLMHETGERLSSLFEHLTTRELHRVIDQSDKLALLPLYLYDHSGLSISTGSFVGRAAHAEWDSGQIGYIYIDKDSALEELCLKEDVWREKAEDYLKAEVASYDNYLTGNVYCIQRFEGLEELYSQGDYNPGRCALKDCFEDMLDGWHPELAQLFEYSSTHRFDIDQYLNETSFPALREELSREVDAFLQTLRDPYPYAISKTDLLENVDGIKDCIVDALYQEHEIPTHRQIFYAVAEAAGYSREVLPRLTSADLIPGKDYTQEELLFLLRQKPTPLDALISRAENENSHISKSSRSLDAKDPDHLRL